MQLRQRLNKQWSIIESSTKNTPDWSELKRGPEDEFPVMLVGPHRQNKYKSIQMVGCNYYGHATSWDNRFIMKRTLCDPKEEPLLFHFNSSVDFKNYNHVFNEADMANVEGCIYGVPLRKLAQLDVEFGNGDGSVRQRIWASLRHPYQEKRVVRCYLYTIDVDFFMDFHTHFDELKPCNKIEYKDHSKTISAYYV